MKKYKSSFNKKMELINSILNSDYTGSAEEWLKDRDMDIESLTDKDIDKIIWAINESKS